MSTDKPYNELGQILSTGGEIALGLAIANGWSTSQITRLFARRFEPMRDDDRQRLIDLANNAVNAAEYANGINLQDRVPLDRIPVNPELFGDQPDGRRFKFITEFRIGEDETWYQVRLDFPDAPTLADIFAMLQSEATSRIGRSPGQFGVNSPTDMPELEFRVVFTERRF